MYPLNWKAEGRPCLVAGAGHVALRKARGLLAAKAEVTVVAPEGVPEFSALAAEGRLRWERASFRPGMERGADLVVSTTGDVRVARYLSEAAARERFLYNAADFPALGNCTLPAHFERGSLTVAVSTEGKSPAFSRYIRQWLETEIPENFGEWLDRLAALREEAKETIEGSRAREAFWRAAFSGDVMRRVAEGQLEEAEEYIRHAMGGFGPES